MPYYPVFVELEGKTIVVVGGGKVAQRKIKAFLEYGAHVCVISKEVTTPLRRYIDEGRIEFLGDRFSEDKLDGALLVIAATDDPDVNRQISLAAHKKNILVNAVDQPSDCSFIVPSIVKSGDLILAISTSGKSPAFAKRLRKEMEKKFGPHYGSFLNLMGRLRTEILSRGLDNDERKWLFDQLAHSPILEAIERQDWHEIAENINFLLKSELSSDDILNLIKVE